MKKLFLLLFCLALVFCFASCSLDLGNSGNNPSNGAEEFDQGNINISTAYAKAQALGYEGSLEEFIEMISGKDGAPGKDGETPTVEISDDGYWVINGVKTEHKAIGTDGKDGIDGEDGKNGTPGKDGVTPTIEISDDG